MHGSSGAVQRWFPLSLSMISFLLWLTWRPYPLIRAAPGSADDTPASAAPRAHPERSSDLRRLDGEAGRRKITSRGVSLKSRLNWVIKQLLRGGNKSLERDPDKQDKRLFLRSDGHLNIAAYSREQTKRYSASRIYFSVIEGENLTDWIFQRPWGRSLWKGL